MPQQLTSDKPAEINFDAGYSLHAVLRVNEPKAGVMFEAAGEGTQFRIRVRTDERGDVYFSARDRSGSAVEAGPVPHNQFADWVYLRCEIEPGVKKATLRIALDNRNMKQARGRLRGRDSVLFSLGSALNGEEPASVSFVEIFQANRVSTPEENEQFVKYYADRYSIGRAALARGISALTPRALLPRLSEDTLKEYLADFRAYQRSIGRDPNDDTLAAMSLADSIICNFLGFSWRQTYNHDGVADTYMLTNYDNSQDGIRHWTRLGRVAEALFELQNVPGFDQRLPHWREMQPHALAAELYGARMLTQADIPFQFREEAGTRGEDFDLVIEPNGLAVCGELKSRVEETSIGVDELLAKLRRAKDQLPKDRPSIVWVRVPESWGASPVIEAVILEATTRLFRTVKRISAVIVHWERFTPLPDGRMLRSIERLIVAHHAPRQTVTTILDRLEVRQRQPFSVFEFVESVPLSAT